jgi:DNA-directed RNA polymerase specialized sigma24 family protein
VDQREADINALIRQHDRLLRYCQRRYGLSVRGSSPDDYREAALEGLIRAYDTFDPEAGCRFSSWLLWKVRDAVQNQCRQFQREWTARLDPLPLNDTAVYHPEPPVKPNPELGAILNRIPGREGKLLRVMVRDGLSIADAGATLGLAPRIAAMVYARAVRRAREIANDDDDD